MRRLKIEINSYATFKVYHKKKTRVSNPKVFEFFINFAFRT